MTETLRSCDVCDFLPTVPKELLVAETEHWTANVRQNDQALLGTCVVALKRHAPELDALTRDEDIDFILVRNALIGSLRQNFEPITFNISCLKNDAFRDDPDATPPEAGHVHWHVKPRYGSEPISFADTTFTDPLPGRYLSEFDRQPVTLETACAIASVLRDKL